MLSDFQLFTEEIPNSKKLSLIYSYELFEDFRIIAESYWYKANRQHQPFGLYRCIKYDVMDFLADLFPERHKSGNAGIYGEQSFEFISTNGLYIKNEDIDIIKSELQMVFPKFILDYYLDELAFLLAYYSWLIPKEKEWDYSKDIHGFFPIQPYEDNYVIEELESLMHDLLQDKGVLTEFCKLINIEEHNISGMKKMELYDIFSEVTEKRKPESQALNQYLDKINSIWDYKEKRLPLIKLIRKLLNDPEVHPILKKHLNTWDYWHELKKKEEIYKEIKRELKTTNNEIPNIMLLKKRAYNTFYCYLKYVVLPSSESFSKKNSFIRKYAIAHKMDRYLAAREIVAKKLYVDSERELLSMTGILFKLIGLFKSSDDYLDNIKEFQKNQVKKLYKDSYRWGKKPDGSLIEKYSKEEYAQLIREGRKEFNIRRNVENLKSYLEDLNSKGIKTQEDYRAWNLKRYASKK